MTFIRSIFLLACLVGSAVAQDCVADTCSACLEGFGCVWNVAGNGTCQDACGGFPNVDCFYARTFGGVGTNDQICEAAANQVEDNAVCFSKTTAESCLQQAGCDWVSGRIESGEDRNWCALDIDYTPAVVPCSSDSCSGCLADAGGICVWMKDGSCKNSCDNFPNINCYYSNMFGVEKADADNAAICEVATDVNLTIAHEACYEELSQDACFKVSGCAWVPYKGTTIDGFCTTYLAAGNADKVSGVPQLSITFVFISAIFMVAAWL